MAGEVVGVNQAIYTRNKGGSIGIGFSIPINDVKFLVGNVLKSGSPHFGWLGVTADTHTLNGACGWRACRDRSDPVEDCRQFSSRTGEASGWGHHRASRRAEDRRNLVAQSRRVAGSRPQCTSRNLSRGAKMTVSATIGEWPREIWASKMEPVPKLNDYADFGVHFVDTPDGPTVKSVVEQSVAWTAGLRKAMSCAASAIRRQDYRRDGRDHRRNVQQEEQGLGAAAPQRPTAIAGQRLDHGIAR